MTPLQKSGSREARCGISSPELRNPFKWTTSDYPTIKTAFELNQCRHSRALDSSPHLANGASPVLLWSAGWIARTWQPGFVFTKLYEVLMLSLCNRRYAGYQPRLEEVANHRMAASYARRLILLCSFHAGK